MKLLVVDQARMARLKLKKHRQAGVGSTLSVHDVAELMDLARQAISLTRDQISGGIPRYLAN